MGETYPQYNAHYYITNQPILAELSYEASRLADSGDMAVGQHGYYRLGAHNASYDTPRPQTPPGQRVQIGRISLEGLQALGREQSAPVSANADISLALNSLRRCLRARSPALAAWEPAAFTLATAPAEAGWQQVVRHTGQACARITRVSLETGYTKLGSGRQAAYGPITANAEGRDGALYRSATMHTVEYELPDHRTTHINLLDIGKVVVLAEQNTYGAEGVICYHNGFDQTPDAAYLHGIADELSRLQ